MDHQTVARVGLTILCALQGLAQVAIDLGRTHAGNLAWARHARFHVIWQSLTVGLLSAVEISLIWMRSSDGQTAFYLAVVLAGLSPLAFCVAFWLRRSYGAALSDPNGIPPLGWEYRGRVRSTDLNTVAVLMALASLGGLSLLFATG